ncbi:MULTISPECIES: hypothetical protein [Pseudomonas syringae group]|nr:hypothetical protein ALP00_200104 [Pseudomonas coronafaciens pv. porri]RMW07936.1 hypothetical protein ALO99_200080 [Pseudomonas coronafaciens pv. porri]
MNPLKPIQQSITTPLISGSQPLAAVGPQAQQPHPERISPSQLSQSAHQALERLSANAEHQRIASMVRNALQDGTFQLQSSNDTQVTYKASICLPADTDTDTDTDTVRTDLLINNELTVQVRLNDKSEYDIVSADLNGSSKAICFDVSSPPPAHGAASSVIAGIQLGMRPRRDIEEVSGRADFINPANYAEQERGVRNLALKQASAARNLLYRPGKSIRREIGQAAGKLLGIVIKLKESELRILTKRLFSSKGLLAGKPPELMKEILDRLSKDATSETSGANAIDRTSFISLMGDIGCLFADANKKSGSFSLSAKDKQAFLHRLSEVIATENLSPLSNETLERVAKISAGTGVVGPKKKEERKRSDYESPRTGLYNLGNKIDEKLGVAEQMRIPKVMWKPMHIKAMRILNTQEPLVAHMSGGPGEILMVWDMLCGQRSEKVYTDALDVHRNAISSGLNSLQPMDHFSEKEKDARLARVAGACAMLVGVGHHSAVEVSESALKYVGQDIRSVLDDPAAQDAAHLLGAGAATDLITELFETQTENESFTMPS